MILAAPLLARIMPRCPWEKQRLYANCLTQVLNDSANKLLTINRIAAFLGQLAWESGDLRYWEERSDGSAYEGRADLGNVKPGDGPRYKGRGPIQLTGRANYRAAGEGISQPLEACPERVLQPQIGFEVAAWYWTSHFLNLLADRWDLRGITRRINGGLNHLEQREQRCERARHILCRYAILL
jgi:predicted chitinase